MANFPVFQFDSSAFPMLTPQQTSPLGGVLSDVIAKRLKMAETRSKNTFADWAGAQSILKALENPLTAGSITNPQALTNSIVNRAQVGNVNNQGNDDGISLSGIGRGILNFLTGGSSNPAPAQQPAQYVPQTASGGGTGAVMQDNGQVSSVPQRTTSNPAPGGVPITEFSQNASTGGRSQENLQYGANAASLKHDVAKGEELGKEEGKQQSEYGPAALAVAEQEKTLKTMNSIFQQPILQKIANTPFINQKSTKWYKQSGTPQEKRALGELDAAQNSFIASSLKMFGGRVTNNDLTFLQSMKPNDEDTMDVKQGKWVALKTFTEAKKEQIKLAHQYMKEGYSQTDAELMAISEINVDSIRDNAYADAFPAPVTIMTPGGKSFSLPKRGAEQLIKDHPTYRILEQ